MKPVIENNPQSLFEKISKTGIPIKNLRLWIIGLPGDSKNFLINKKGLIKEIRYKDYNNKNYKIIYNKYNKKINPPLPENIELHQENSIIILKIKNWNLIKN